MLKARTKSEAEIESKEWTELEARSELKDSVRVDGMDKV